jgi:hypothetical protein
MNRRIVPALLVLFGLTVGVAAHAGSPPPAKLDPTPNLDGWWHNQLGSEMEVKYNAKTGTLSGRYRTNTGPTPDAFYPVTGTVNGDVISFMVNWKRPIDGGTTHGSVATWVGQHTLNKEGKDEIRTMWLLQRNTPDAEEEKNMWESAHTGSDVFHQGRVPKASKPRDPARSPQ